MAQSPEGKVKAAVKKRLEHYGLLPFMKVPEDGPAPTGTYWMPVQGAFAVHGVHDFCGVWCGWFWSIETKAPNNPEDATANQQQFHVAVTRSGGISMIGVRDASAVDRLYEMIQERNRCLNTPLPVSTRAEA